MAAVEIASGVWRIPTAPYDFINSSLFADDDGGVWNVRGLRYGPAGSCTDARMSRKSADRLGEQDFEIAAFTHGAHVSDGAPAALRAFLAGRPS